MEHPQSLHQRGQSHHNAYDLLLFIYSTKTGQRPYNNHASHQRRMGKPEQKKLQHIF
jgi:hypothetical protein